MHFTRIEHLPTIIEHGLMSDRLARNRGVLSVEIGDRGIKQQRLDNRVDCGPGGAVADYAPLYFAPCSPMMSGLAHGKYTYRDGFNEVIYLVTTMEDLHAAGCSTVVTDRNAALAIAAMSTDEADWSEFVDWDLMQAKWWFNTPEYPDRRERRMAEALVHGSIPFAAFRSIVTKTDATALSVRGILAEAGIDLTVAVRPHWYF
ncbi:MAG TPA: DUF4433 domain-containing protein [Nocardioides sp.]